MSFDHKTSLCFSGVLFIILLFIGVHLSQHKLLWIDECFTQHQSVEGNSYAEILTLKIPDGNKCPLFYVLQKLSGDLFSFHYPQGQAEASFDVPDRRAQIIIRIPSNIYMSLALAAIFYYMMRFFSLPTAIYAMAVALVSPMVWMYWVEARPYSLWFLLTTAQLLFYCFICRKGPAARPYINKLIYGVHILLILTTPGSIFQVAIISGMLFWKTGFKKRQLIWSFFLPAGIFLIYYFLVPLFKFRTFNLFICLFDVVLPEHLFVYVLYALTAWLMSKYREKSSNTFFLWIFLLFLISGCFVLVMDLFTNKFQFGLFSRYLIYLTPADILMYSLASYDLWHWARKNVWVCVNVSIFLGCLMITRGLMTYRDIMGSALYSHLSG